MNKLLISTLVAAALGASALPALSQDVTSPAKDPKAAQSHRQAKALPSERVESRITELKTALKITPAQEPQWNAFADTLRKQARAGDDRVKQFRAARADKGAKPAPATAIQRLEQRQAFMKEASARMDELLATARPLYAALSPEQQKTADELMARHGRDGHRGHGGPRPTKG